MGRTQHRRRVEPTEEWEQLKLLCLWPEQRAYEEIRPLTLFGNSVAQRAAETGTPERTLYRRVGRFETEVEAGTGGLRAVGGAELFESSLRHDPPQRRLFALAELGEGGWLKVLRLEAYVSSAPRRPSGLQKTLFPHHEASG
jgi:hypothetical protein